ncbi:PKD domain-containing protein [Candidatus Bathyarchaeota archaeon]|nr:MAG: PKD domain-containing protein [Candidatus Bathyarchaeota archaeon]
MRLLKCILLLIILTASSTAVVALNQAQSSSDIDQAKLPSLASHPTNTKNMGLGSTTTATVRDINVTISGISPNPARTLSNVTISFSAVDSNDMVSSVSVDWGDGYSHTLPGSASSDSHSYNSTGRNISKPFIVNVTATDLAGSFGSNTTLEVINDQPPIVAIFVTGGYALTGDTVSATFLASDVDGNVSSISINWGDGSGSQVIGFNASTINFPSVHSYASAGDSQSHSFNINVNATDNAGSTGHARSAVLIRDRPPTLTISRVSPSPASGGQTVTLTFIAADSDGTISNVSIDWGDGTTPETLRDSTTFGTHTYARFVGEMQIIVVATDNSGSTATQMTLLYVNSPPAPAGPYTILGFPPMIFYGIIGAWIAAAAISSTLVVAYRRKTV